MLKKATGLVQVDAKLISDLFPSRNVAGQWNQVFVQPLPEEEVTVRQDQDPRVSTVEQHQKLMRSLSRENKQSINKIRCVQEAVFDAKLEQGVDRNTDPGDDVDNGRTD